MLVRALNHDGSLLLYGDQPIQVDGRRRASRVVRRAPGRQPVRHVLARRRTVLSTGTDGTLREWDPVTGRRDPDLPRNPQGPVAATPDGLVLTIGHSGSNRTPATLIDTRPRGELGAVETCPGSWPPTASGWEAGWPCSTSPATVPRHHLCRRRAGAACLHAAGHQAQAARVSPDGTRFVRQEGAGTMHGPLAVRDLAPAPRSSSSKACAPGTASSPLPPEQQEGCATYPEQPFGIQAVRLRWSPDGTMIAAAAGTTVVVWDADTERCCTPTNPTRPAAASPT